MEPITIITDKIKIYEILLSKDKDNWVVSVDYALLKTDSTEFQRKRITLKAFTTSQKTKMTNLLGVTTKKIENYETSLFNKTQFKL